MADGSVRSRESAAACAIIGPWKALEAPLNRNSVLPARGAVNRGFALLPTLGAIAASIACGVTSSHPFAPPVVNTAPLPV